MDNGVLLNKEEINFAMQFLRRTPTIYTCRNVIQQQLFSNGILFNHRRGRVRPDPHMQEIMTDYWLPFCKDVLDSVMIQGIAICRIVTMDDGLQVPVALEPNTCNIYLKYNLGVREYIAMDDQHNEIPEAIIFDIFGYSPDSKGHICSVVSNLMPTVRYMNTLMGTSLSMEQKRASPTLMTEAVDTKSDSVEGVQYDWYADGDMQDDSERNKFRRNSSNVSQLAQQQQMYDNYFSSGGALSSGGDVLANVVALPLGQRLVNIPAQTGRSDLVAQLKMQEDIICGTMGVPRSLFMSDTPHKSDSEGTHQTFHKTVMAWKTLVQTTCERIYNLIYAENIKVQMLKAMGKTKKRKRESTVAEMYALKKRLQVEIIFPVSPFVSIDTMHQHWERGLLPWETYLQHACTASGLPYESMPEPSKEAPSAPAPSAPSAPSPSKEEEDK